MARDVLYVAHALRPTEDEIAAMRECEVFKGGPSMGARARQQYDLAVSRCALRANLDRAVRSLAWLRRLFPETTFIAPWIASILSGEDDADPAQREAGLVDACAVIERCNGIVLCGDRVSDGMRREAEHWLNTHGYDLTPWGPEAVRSDVIPPKVYDLTGYQIEGSSGRNDGSLTFVRWMDRYQESCTR